MPLITWNLDTNALDLSGIDTSLQDKLEMPAPSEQTIRIGFYRQGSGDTQQFLDLGSDPGLQFIIKRSTGANKYDATPIVASPTFTRTAVDDLGNYYYEGSLSLSSPQFLKDLGINAGFLKETINIKALSNDDSQLFRRYFDIYFSATEFYRMWFDNDPTSGDPPSQGGASDLVRVKVAEDDSAETVAAAIETAFNDSITTSSISTSGDTVYIEFLTGTLGTHDPQNSGVEITVTQAGSGPSDVADVTSFDYSGQLLYLDGTNPQLSPMFTLTLTNSLYRDGQTFPSGVASSNTRTGSVTLSASDSATVTFSTAMPTAEYKIVESVVRYTGAGSPGLKLCATTIDDRATTGYTVYFNGDATTSYTYDYTVSA